jgi:hypothetical protein
MPERAEAASWSRARWATSVRAIASDAPPNRPSIAAHSKIVSGATMSPTVPATPSSGMSAGTRRWTLPHSAADKASELPVRERGESDPAESGSGHEHVRDRQGDGDHGGADPHARRRTAKRPHDRAGGQQQQRPRHDPR